MSINWIDVNRAVSPVKDYEDLCRRFQVSFAYPFVRETFNFTLPEMARYTERLLGGDLRGRYTEYAGQLVGAFARLQQAGVRDVLELVTGVGSRAKLGAFIEQSKVDTLEVIAVLKYLVYWFVPGEKYLGTLVREAPAASEAIQVLSGLGIRTNLDLLQHGHSPAGRQALVKASGLPAEVIGELVNRADFSRLPWASKATISNIIGAGYGSLAQLANADPQQLYADFFAYGKAIGKNLKLGNEIESSHRIAKIVPVVVRDG